MPYRFKELRARFGATRMRVSGAGRGAVYTLLGSGTDVRGRAVPALVFNKVLPSPCPLDPPPPSLLLPLPMSLLYTPSVNKVLPPPCPLELLSAPPSRCMQKIIQFQENEKHSCPAAPARRHQTRSPPPPLLPTVLPTVQPSVASTIKRAALAGCDGARDRAAALRLRAALCAADPARPHGPRGAERLGLGPVGEAATGRHRERWSARSSPLPLPPLVLIGHAASFSPY